MNSPAPHPHEPIPLPPPHELHNAFTRQSQLGLWLQEAGIVAHCGVEGGPCTLVSAPDVVGYWQNRPRPQGGEQSAGGRPEALHADVASPASESPASDAFITPESATETSSAASTNLPSESARDMPSPASPDPSREAASAWDDAPES